jgi:DHA1 family bicyclomycin/chloramphenicol resistance-like MFS transporter
MRLDTPDPKRPTLAQFELIALVGLLMSLNALAIDIFLPALDDIGMALGSPGNERQLIVTSYIFGFGLGQLFMGPMTDAFGRRTVLLFSIFAFAFASLLCALSPFLGFMIVVRFLQGLAAAGTRVVATAIVRDLVSGRRMAQIMSFAMTVFMVAPLLAPALGELVLFVSHWRMIFVVLVVAAAAMMVWSLLRLPETLPIDRRRALSLSSIMEGYGWAMRSRIILGYTMTSTAMFGALYLFLSTSEQVFVELYGLHYWFALAFAGVSLCLAAASLLNARIVRRYGMRRISHYGVLGYLLINLIHAGLAYFGDPPFWLFFTLLSFSTMVFGVVAANFSALVIEPAGDRAGTVSAFYGATTAMLGAVIGAVTGLLYDGSVFPVVLGYAALGIAGFVLAYWTEQGVMFGKGDPIGDPAGD